MKKGRLRTKTFRMTITALVLLIIPFFIVCQILSQKYIFEREELQACSTHEKIVHSFEKATSFLELSDGKQEITISQIRKVAQSVFYYNKDDVSLFLDGKLITCTNFEQSDIDTELATQEYEEEYTCRYLRFGDSDFIKVISKTEVYGKSYTLITTMEISDVYVYAYENRKKLGIIIVASGIALGVLIWLLFRIYFKPLDIVNENLSLIAAGDYQRVIPVKTTDEFGSLAYNINRMTSYVRANMDHLAGWAKSQEKFIQTTIDNVREPLNIIKSISEKIQTGESVTKEEWNGYIEQICHEVKTLKTQSQDIINVVYIGNVNPYDLKKIEIRDILEEGMILVDKMAYRKYVKLWDSIHNFTVLVEPEMFLTLICHCLDLCILVAGEHGGVEVCADTRKKKKFVKFITYSKETSRYNDVKDELMVAWKLCQKIISAHGYQGSLEGDGEKGIVIQLYF